MAEQALSLNHRRRSSSSRGTSCNGSSSHPIGSFKPPACATNLVAAESRLVLLLAEPGL